MDSSTTTLWTDYFQKQGAWLVFTIIMFYVFNANSVDPDQMLQNGSALFANYPFGGLQTKTG